MNKNLYSRRRWLQLSGAAGLTAATVPCLATRLSAADAVQVVDIGGRRRRELFVDHYLIGRLAGARLQLHRPRRREIVFRTDAPWEGNGSAYQSVCQDADLYSYQFTHET